ncbi:MAG: hypothetical protein GTO41_13600 [Burkholderiales bacterium]|nr:hypothetical protein [Burkholderiales bacterium]
MIRLLAGAIALSFCSGAVAQDSYTVDSVAQLRDNESARFSSSSLREFRGQLMFDVLIRYVDPADIPPGGIASRTITYSARCASSEMSIAVIELRDSRGQTKKIITVPPGAEEYFKPSPGSREDEWLHRACS